MTLVVPIVRTMGQLISSISRPLFVPHCASRMGLEAEVTVQAACRRFLALVGGAAHSSGRIVPEASSMAPGAASVPCGAPISPTETAVLAGITAPRSAFA